MTSVEYHGEITAHGITLVSRHGSLRELKELIAFAELAHADGIARYISTVFYDSGCCMATFGFHCGDITPSDPLFGRVWAAAEHSLSQFELGDIIGHRRQEPPRGLPITGAN